MSDTTHPALIDEEDECCAEPFGHDGPCYWICGDCEGTGRCTFCAEECFCDDVIQCDWCDGSHACPGSCIDGRIEDDG